MLKIKRSQMMIATTVVLVVSVSGALRAPAYGATSAHSVPASLGSPRSARTEGSFRTLSFAGYQWSVKSSTSPIGPGPNTFDTYGPFVDSSGDLHLRVFEEDGIWECSEVILDSALGYGTYRWTVDGPVANLDPNVVFAAFTWDDADTPPAHKEMDFEASRFTHPTERTNAQYVVQPNGQHGNRARITLPNPNVTRVVMTWLPGRVTFSADSLPPWTNNSSWVPVAGGAQVHMNLWLFHGVPPTNKKRVSVVVTAFHFTPAQSG